MVLYVSKTWYAKNLIYIYIYYIYLKYRVDHSFFKLIVMAATETQSIIRRLIYKVMLARGNDDHCWAPRPQRVSPIKHRRDNSAKQRKGTYLEDQVEYYGLTNFVKKFGMLSATGLYFGITQLLNWAGMQPHIFLIHNSFP